MRSALAAAGWQATFPVVDAESKLVGLVSASSVGILSPDNPVHAEASAADVMQPPAALDPTDDLRKAAELILLSGFRQLPVIGPDRQIAGFLEESEVTRAYLNLATQRDEAAIDSVT